MVGLSDENTAAKSPMSAQMRKALDEVGGEPLAGCGFENEAPEPDSSATEPIAPEPWQ
jgi:hypothetical protein